MTVHAKFKCASVNFRDPGQADAVNAELKLSAVYGDGKDNASWSKWTPSGELTMVITNPGAAHYFKAGREYYLKFEEVPLPEAKP